MRDSPSASSFHVVPPPKQKPMAPIFASFSRFSSSSSPALRSSRICSSVSLFSSAVAAAGSLNLSAPPARETRSTQRGVARLREPADQVVEVRRQALVLVHDEHGALGVAGRRLERALQVAVLALERDRVAAAGHRRRLRGRGGRGGGGRGRARLLGGRPTGGGGLRGRVVVRPAAGGQDRGRTRHRQAEHHQAAQGLPAAQQALAVLLGDLADQIVVECHAADPNRRSLGSPPFRDHVVRTTCTAGRPPAARSGAARSSGRR
jgi:hypothetical protein